MDTNARNAFEAIQQLHEDYSAGWLVLRAAHADAEAIAESAAERMAMERERREQRRAELIEQRDDIERALTVRRLAEAELARLDEQKIVVTEAEVEAHAAAIEEARAAIEDLREIAAKTYAAIEAVNAEVKKIRKGVVGDNLIELAPGKTARLEARFAKLREEVNA